MRSTVRPWLVVVACVLGIGVGACSSDSSSDAGSTSTSTSPSVTTMTTTGSGDTIAAGEDQADNPAAGNDPDAEPASLELADTVTVNEVTCSVTGGGEVPCNEAHDTESFTLSGTEALDDCFRAVAATSDVVIVAVPSDPSSLAFEGDQIIGHAFSGGVGDPVCQITLTETRTEALVQR